ncbi:MAG TPA: DUF177 domain-containing protein [Mycobacterium sp.]|nr:DUF177 domain-containing protein [Mycobacterium sp.]
MARHPSVAAQRRRSSPFVIDIVRLGRRPGTMMAVRDQIANPAQIGLDLIAIKPGATLELDLRLESVSEGVLVTGTVAAPTAGECARCLTPLTDRTEVELTELFAYPDSTTDATTEEDELGRVINDTVDLEQAIVDAVGLALPLSPLCRPDCPGLCPQCGTPLADAGPDHHHDQVDPRWAKLAGMVGPDPIEQRGHGNR